ncbi:hypothetical protein LTR48_004602, partial [Friedmanniomyces endolithicus]
MNGTMTNGDHAATNGEKTNGDHAASNGTTTNGDHAASKGSNGTAPYTYALPKSHQDLMER